MRPKAEGVVIARVKRDPGQGPGTAAGLSMPGSEQGRLAPAGRSDDEGEGAPHGSVNPLREPWAQHHVRASGRYSDFRRQQMEGGQTGGGGERGDSSGLKRRERAMW